MTAAWRLPSIRCSSSHQVSSLSNAWGVEFNRGWLLYGYRSAQGVVRLVRDAP